MHKLLKVERTAAEEKMANLPEDCVQPAPPFSYYAIDYFSHLYVKKLELKQAQPEPPEIVVMASKVVKMPS